MAHQFTPEETRRGAEVSNRVQSETRAQRDRRSLIIWEIVNEVEDLAPATLSAVLTLVTRAAESADTLEIENPLDLQRVAQSAEILHRISRLASGQSTSNTAHAVLSDEERRERMARIRGDVGNVGTPVPDPGRSDA